MADMCAYCSLDTGGNHETNCPLYPGNNPKLNYSTHPLMGSGYDQGFKAGRKQGGAEVLAACAQRGFDAAIEEGPPAQVEDTAAYIRDEILKVQPAASDLEGLLREARLDEAKWWEHLSQASHEQHPSYEDCMYCVRIAELEKARASGRKG